MKKTLLITGSTGFIGQNLLKFIESKFENKYNIVLLSSSMHDKYKTVLHKNYSFVKNDFEEQGIKNIDIIIHVGAFTPKSSSEANDIEKSNANIFNTNYLLKNLPALPSKFIFLSTIDVYGKIESIIDEAYFPNPISMYGWSKLYCEKMIENWAAHNQVIFQILRVGHIYGKGEEAYKKVIPVTIQKLKDGKSPQIFGTGDEKRSFLHVDDVCYLIIKSISLEKYEGVINLCSSKSYTIKEIVEMLINISKKDLTIDYVETQNRGIDFVFDTPKMNRLLGCETVLIEDGLKDEYQGEENE